MAGFLESLIGTESGGNWRAQNSVMGAGGKSGHFGRLQFGQARLADAMNAGVIPQGMTPEQFMADPASQQRVEAWHFGDIDKRAGDMGLNRFVGQTVGGISITPEAIRAMAHLGGIGGAQRFLETGGQYNPSDAYGTSLADYAIKHGGTGGSQVRVSTMGDTSLLGAAPAQPDKPRGLLGFLADPDKRAKLAMALEGMTLNPNQGLMQALGGEIKDRRDTRTGEAAKNKTVAWLRANGQEQLASALETGAVDAGAVVQQALQAMQPQAAPEKTALVQNYEYALSQGMTPEQARAWVQNGTTVNVGGDGAPTPSLLGTSGLVAIPDPSSPQGWRVEPAPGSPLAADAAKVEKAATVAAGSKETAGGIIGTAAQRARDAAKNPTATGVAGAGLSYLPFTDAAEVYRQVEVLQSQAKVENLTAMRAASPTGAALGAVSDKENAMLAAKSGVLDPKSPNFLRDLDDFELTLLQTIHGPAAGKAIFDQTRSGAAPPAQGGVATVTNDAEYDALPSGTQFTGPDGKTRRKP